MTTKEIKTDESHSEIQAGCQLESIKEMVAGLNVEETSKDYTQRINEDALDVNVRSGWYPPHDATSENRKAEEYTILLCSGGPACRIIGKLSEHGEPETARIEHQDWGTPWTEYRITGDDEKIVLQYVCCFYFGE